MFWMSERVWHDGRGSLNGGWGTVDGFVFEHGMIQNKNKIMKRIEK